MLTVRAILGLVLACVLLLEACAAWNLYGARGSRYECCCASCTFIYGQQCIQCRNAVHTCNCDICSCYSEIRPSFFGPYTDLIDAITRNANGEHSRSYRTPVRRSSRFLG